MSNTHITYCCVYSNNKSIITTLTDVVATSDKVNVTVEMVCLDFMLSPSNIMNNINA